MAFIKKFRNGKPVDPIVSSQIEQLLTPPPTILVQPPQVPLQQIPIPTPIQIPTPPSPKALPKVAPSRGGCGCGKK